MRVRTFATRTSRCDEGARRPRRQDRGGDGHDQECFAETKYKTFAAGLRSGGADRLHPASGVAAPRRDLRQGNRNQSHLGAMGGARQAHRDRTLLAESARAADGNGCRHHQGCDRPAHRPRPDRNQRGSAGRPPPARQPDARRPADGRESRAERAGDHPGNAGAARCQRARDAGGAVEQAAVNLIHVLLATAGACGLTFAPARARWRPSTITRSSAVKPSRITRRPSLSGPSTTGFASTVSSSLTTNTTLPACSVAIATSGTNTAPYGALPISLTRQNWPGRIERSLLGITARPRRVPVEPFIRLSTKSILPSCEASVSPITFPCTGFGVSRELGRLPSK